MTLQELLDELKKDAADRMSKCVGALKNGSIARLKKLILESRPDSVQVAIINSAGQYMSSSGTLPQPTSPSS